MKGMTTCKICGRDFPLITEKHYIARDPDKVGAFAALTIRDERVLYDSFDCPHCGCQNIMQTRKPLWMPEESDKSEEDVFGHDGCFECIHADVPTDEKPCCECKGNYIDHYKKEENN